MKILVLSNDEMERSVIHQVVQHNGHEVLVAGNSDDAMQFLQEGEIRFVIVDRNTTDAEEKQFIKRIRDAQPPYYIYILLIASKVQDLDITTPRGGAEFLSMMYDPSNPAYASPAPAPLQNYFLLQKIFSWGGYLLLPVVLVILLVVVYKKGNKVDKTMSDESWTLLLITVGVASSYFWLIFQLYSRMMGFIRETAGENSMMTFLLGCPPLVFMFPVYTLVLATRPRRKSIWWWAGLFVAFGVPVATYILLTLVWDALPL